MLWAAGDRGPERLSKEGMLLESKKRLPAWVVFLVLAGICIIGIVLTGGHGEGEDIKVMMRDAVLHDVNQVRIFNWLTVTPSVVSAYVVTALLLSAAVLIRLLVIPRFTEMPGRLQMLLEMLVDTFGGLVRKYSPHRTQPIFAYIFGVGIYVFVGTCFELLGWQVVSTAGHSIALPAPLADINGAIATGVMSYLMILTGGIAGNGVKGIGLTLKEFSLPISMSFRLFGSLLSGLLVTELVYAYIHLSFVLPVVVAVMFTLLHALIQTYVLTMLTALFFGEVSEPRAAHQKKGR